MRIRPCFLGYITTSATPIGALGDFLAGAINSTVGGWELAPMGTQIEAQTVRWIEVDSEMRPAAL